MSTKRPRSESQVYEVDFTFWKPSTLPVPEFIKVLRTIFKKWVFQLEKAPNPAAGSDGLHYQGRGSLIKKKRIPELLALVSDTALAGGIYFTPSSNNSLVGDCFYTIKLDTRVDGPWDNRTWMEPEYIPRQYRGLMDRLWPCQEQILNSRHWFNDRTCNFLFDPDGCTGKSTIGRLAALHFRALRLPCVGDAKQLLEAACDILMAQQNRTPGLCFVDLPRTLTMDSRKFAPFMIAVEEIKAGVVSDMRNHYKEWWFDSPSVWITCNHLPKTLEYLSADRFVFWTLDSDKNLVKRSRDEMIQMIQPPEE